MLARSKLLRPSLSLARTPQSVVGMRFVESYSERQEKKGRPVSPHVTIYKFPAVALSSITNRVTGVVLTGGITAIGALSLAGCDVVGLMNTIGNMAAVGTVAKFGVSFPLIYHYLGGVRHLVWDRKPELVTNEQVEKSSYALFAASAVSAAAVSLL
eukprot:gene32026-38726_t